ncbi:MAG: Rqc2 family fibronectin-binding protein [Limnochordia bacterium]|jgi:predicted ribosome quality control (RQC) complex YloA/Tae2 family protein
MDGIMLAALRSELEEKLLGARIHKIYQHPGGEIYLHFRRPGESYQLLLAPNPQDPRAYLTEEVKENPATPPAFCMLLRKYLETRRLLAVEQPGLERVLELSFESSSADKGLVDPRLILEIMGRYSNLILIDDGTRQILGAWKNIDSQMSRYRQIAPGLPYLPPPAQGKIDLSRQSLPPLDIPLEKDAFIAHLAGVGPHTARELAYRARSQGLMPTLQELQDMLRTKAFCPSVGWEGEQPVAISAMAITYRPSRTYPGPSAALAAYYQQRLHQRELGDIRTQLTRIVKNRIDKERNKLAKQEAALAQAQRADEHKLRGELIMTHLHLIEKGQDQVTVNNYYADNEPLTIPLDPRYDGVQNAQLYFRRYRKGKKGQAATHRQIEGTRGALAHWEGLLETIEEGDLEQLKGLQETLTKGDGAPRRQLPQGSRPRQFISQEGQLLLVGRNSRQNEALLRRAHSEDFWLHTKDIPGSHVIIPCQGRPVSQETLEEAARLAAYYSAARESTKVPVDYTRVKHVRKIPGAAPGMVSYEGHKTLYVSPRPDLLPKEKRDRK